MDPKTHDLVFALKPNVKQILASPNASGKYLATFRDLAGHPQTVEFALNEAIRHYLPGSVRPGAFSYETLVEILKETDPQITNHVDSKLGLAFIAGVWNDESAAKAFHRLSGNFNALMSALTLLRHDPIADYTYRKYGGHFQAFSTAIAPYMQRLIGQYHSDRGLEIVHAPEPLASVALTLLRMYGSSEVCAYLARAVPDAYTERLDLLLGSLNNMFGFSFGSSAGLSYAD